MYISILGGHIVILLTIKLNLYPAGISPPRLVVHLIINIIWRYLNGLLSKLNVT